MTTAAQDPAVPSADGACHFYRLPRELRDEIHKLAFADQKRSIFAPAAGTVFGRAVYHTASKQWKAEATPIFLRQITAVIGSRRQLEEFMESTERRLNITSIVLALPCVSIRCDRTCGSAHSVLPFLHDLYAREGWRKNVRDEAKGLAAQLNQCSRLKSLYVQVFHTWTRVANARVRRHKSLVRHDQGISGLINNLIVELEALKGTKVKFIQPPCHAGTHVKEESKSLEDYFEGRFTAGT